MSVFVDSDAFIALAKVDDTNHRKAIEIFERLKHDESTTFTTSNYVFAETVTVISYRISHEAAVDFIEKISSTGSPIILHRHTQDTEALAIEIFREQTSKNVSFVDCTNIAFVRHWKIDAIFSFDEIYEKNRLLIIDRPDAAL